MPIVGNKTYKLTTFDKSDILSRVAAGEDIKALAKEYGVDRTAIYHLQKKYNTRVETIKVELDENRTQLQKRLLGKTFQLLEKKIDKTLGSDKTLETTRIDHISGVLMDLWKQLQVSEGNPTDITQSNKNVTELQMYLISNFQNLSSIKPYEVLLNNYDTYDGQDNKNAS